MTRQEQAQAYRSYCQAIALNSGLKGKALSERIAECNRQSYFILFNDRNIRQRNMTEQQLIKLSEHRAQVTSAMILKAGLR